jgi:hypothetical protein
MVFFLLGPHAYHSGDRLPGNIIELSLVASLSSKRYTLRSKFQKHIVQSLGCASPRGHSLRFWNDNLEEMFELGCTTKDRTIYFELNRNSFHLAEHQQKTIIADSIYLAKSMKISSLVSSLRRGKKRNPENRYLWPRGDWK